MKRGLFGPGTDEKYDNQSGKTNNKWPQEGPIKTLGLLEKKRVGQETGNTYIFWPKGSV